MNKKSSALKWIAGIAVLMASMLAPISSNAQWVLLEKDADAIVRGGFDALYNLRYDEADSLFTGLTRTNPNHPAGYFLLALVDWWRIVPNTDDNVRLERYSDSFNKRLDKVIDISDVRLDDNPKDVVGLFFKGAALGYKSRLKLMNISGTAILTQGPSAALDAREAYSLLMDAQAIAPSNSDILLGSGIFMYASAAFPEKYPAFKSIASFAGEGDKVIGLNMLRISAKRAAYASVEAKYALLEFLMQFERNYTEAKQIALELHASYPENPVFHRMVAQSYYMTSDFANADSTYKEIVRRVLARDRGYEMTMARRALYYLGDIRMRTGSYESAVKHFQYAIDQGRRLDGKEETSWMALSVLKLGMVYDLLGKRADAIKQYRQALSLDDAPYDKKDTHEWAEQYLETPYKK